LISSIVSSLFCTNISSSPQSCRERTLVILDSAATSYIDSILSLGPIPQCIIKSSFRFQFFCISSHINSTQSFKNKLFAHGPKKTRRRKKGKLKLLSTLLSISTNHNGHDSLLKWATFSFAVF
jgi:hypothetical protein